MKLKEFRKKMQMPLFSTAQARIVCFSENPHVLNLQMHQWKKSGDLVSLKRGLYMFSDIKPVASEIARSLYAPCYLSLEYALSFYGILPEAVFEYTLVTTKATRRFETPVGVFTYRTISRKVFTGFDANTLMAEKEKALVDWFYFNTPRLEATETFWEQSRLEAMTTDLDFKKVFRYARLFQSKKLLFLLHSFHTYATSRQTH